MSGYEIYVDESREYRWCLTTADGTTVGVSPDGFIRKAGAERTTAAVRELAPLAPIETVDHEGPDGWLPLGDS